MDMCHPDEESTTIGPDFVEETFNFYPGPCKGDIKRIIGELERIPDLEHSNPGAAEEFALLKVERDSPQDFEAAQEAYYRKCVAPMIARRKAAENTVPCPGPVRDGKCEVLGCGNAYLDCAPFATSEQYGKWRASAENEN